MMKVGNITEYNQTDRDILKVTKTTLGNHIIAIGKPFIPIQVHVYSIGMLNSIPVSEMYT